MDEQRIARLGAAFPNHGPVTQAGVNDHGWAARTRAADVQAITAHVDQFPGGWIGARIGGIPELIRENQTGACFESGNVESLRNLLEDFTARAPQQLADMGRVGRRWVVEDFTVAMYRQRIMSVYRDLGVPVAAASPLPLRASS